jgi:hypothetical protein
MRHAGVILLLALLVASEVRAAEVDYVRDVKPLLQKHCYSCHSGLRAKSGLRVDHISFLRTGGDRGSALAEKASESPLLQALDGSGDIERMPLEAKPLAAEEIATIKAWIEAGSPTPDEPLPIDPTAHWSFQKPQRPALPEVKNADWAAHPIDRFLAAVHEREQLEPAPPADKNLLLRRVYIDLIGLPPSPAELNAFLADTSDDAYEKVVDQLLASPHYGERWGRHWMDVWRYSDWDGYGAEIRESQPHIWRWRDWIVESLNADKPYDEMVVEMLAADETHPLDENAQRATGYLARNWYKFNRNVWLDNTVEHTAKAFLGVTVNCARCHDHMYDPILQTDYYQFRAFFEPHKVRTDRVPGQSDTNKDGLVRAFDAQAETPTFLFTRGNEASPDKDNPLMPGVPQSLGGDKLEIAPIALPAEARYPGLRSFVQQEALASATAEVARAEQAMTTANTALAEVRKKQADLVAANAAKPTEPPPAGNGAEAAADTPADANPAEVKPAEQPAPPLPVDPASLNADVAKADRAVAVAEGKLLVSAAQLVSVRAKIAADQAQFADPPREDAKTLAREASRAENVANAEQSKLDVLQAEHELAEAQAATDEGAKKRVEAAQAKFDAAKKKRGEHQVALGKIDENYTHFGEVYPATSTGRRAALARWIASKNNPLTARVAINQIWMRHFGTPLVYSVFDFGLHGEKPSHPELLDWLAVELMDRQWRMKDIHRLIVTSRAYRMQSGTANAGNLARDPENRYLWHANPRRMEAEVVRDSTLQVAGALDVTMGGPELDQNSGMKSARRSLYFRSSKEKKMTFLDMFDRANVTDCYRRSETVVPQQALAMVNSPLSLAQARRLAGSLAAELKTEATPESEQAFVVTAFDRILCRPATEEERSTCLEFLSEQAARLAKPQELVAFTSGDENAIKPAADAHQRARENLIHVLLNHNDFLTVR